MGASLVYSNVVCICASILCFLFLLNSSLCQSSHVFSYTRFDRSQCCILPPSPTQSLVFSSVTQSPTLPVYVPSSEPMLDPTTQTSPWQPSSGSCRPSWKCCRLTATHRRLSRRSWTRYSTPSMPSFWTTCYWEETCATGPRESKYGQNLKGMYVSAVLQYTILTMLFE